MKLRWFVFQAVWILLILPALSGENLCKDELLKHVNVSTELQSDVLLPCNFNPTLLGSDKTADIAVVWRQWNTTGHNLLEISLQGEAKFWDYKGGRIKTFPKLTESGNFSIVLQNVQLYDLSLYRCRLFNAPGCSIAYQELQLYGINPQSHEKSLLLWSIAGALAGATVLLVVVTVCFLHAKRRKNITAVAPDNENVGATSQSDRGSKSIHNPIYETSYQFESRNCQREEEGCSSDIPVYATVKKGKPVNST